MALLCTAEGEAASQCSTSLLKRMLLQVCEFRQGVKEFIGVFAGLSLPPELAPCVGIPKDYPACPAGKMAV